jgi:hypothetical protein
VRVRGGIERLRRSLELSGMLEPDERIRFGIDTGEIPGASSLNFVFHPKRINSIEYE